MPAIFSTQSSFTANVLQRGVWPTPRQEMLLRAIILQGEASVSAWNAWKPTFDDGLDLASFRLMPLLYHNLQQQGVNDPLLGRIKGIHRKTWVENQVLFRHAARALAELRAAGIPTLLLKGSALSLYYYPNAGLRPMNDIDVLVPTAQRDSAIQVLIQAGWSPKLELSTQLTPARLQVNHAQHFRHADGGAIDLHWHVLIDRLAPDEDDDFWQAAIPLTLYGIESQTLNPADMLLHLCHHGLRWDKDLPLRWIPDIMAVLRARGEDIDWERVVRQAQKRRISINTLAALTYLRRNFAAPIPPETLSQLQQLPVTWQERCEAFVFWRSNALFGYLLNYGVSFLFCGDQHGYRGVTGFLRFLQVQEGQASIRETLYWIIKRGFWRLTRSLQRKADYSVQKKIT